MRRVGLAETATTVRQDWLAAIGPDQGLSGAARLLLRPEVGAVIEFRLRTWLSGWLIGRVLTAVTHLGAKVWCGVDIQTGAEVGPGLRLVHGFGVVVGPGTVLGAQCTIYQGCTVGQNRGGEPTVGNDVVLNAGSVIAGPISVGDGVVIGANAVVLDSVPDRRTIVGNPGRLLPQE